MRIETILSNVTYYNDENGYCVLKDEEGKAFVGYMMFNPKNIIGIPVVIHCKKEKGKYGLQYKFSEIEHSIPPLFHFLTGVIKGVQKSAAIELANRYQTIDNLEEAINKEEREILKIKGIGKKSVEKLKQGLKKNKSLYELAELLLPYGVSPSIIKKIYKEYQEEYQDDLIIERLKEDPYTILTSIKGIGFKKADEIVLKAKLVSPTSVYRAKAGIIYIFLSIMEDKGDTVLKKEDVKKKFYELLSKDDFTEEDFNKAFNLLIEDKRLLLVNKEEDTYSLSAAFYTEKGIFNFVKKPSFSFLSRGEKFLIEQFLLRYEETNGIKLDENQKKAVIEALTSFSPIYIIAGYAGTGKTTTSKTLVEFLKKRKKKIVGCALSGAAANRLKSVTGIKAYTIHSLLGYRRTRNKKEPMFKYNVDNKLKYDLVILDEASMVNATLFFHLMQAIDTKKTKLLMLGDDAQLPPIGWGEVFADLLEWECVPKTKLTKIYRQDETKVISLFAGEIRQGRIPKGYKESGYSDFKFVSFNIPVRLSNLSPEIKKQYREENNTKIRNYILNGFISSREDILKSLKLFEEKFGEELEKGLSIGVEGNTLLKEYISRIQLISAIKNGILGTNEMNTDIKNILNPLKEDAIEGIDYISIRNPKNGVVKTFSKFDKVIHLKNQDMFCSYVSIHNAKMIEDRIYSSSEERVYNGQVGIITGIIPKIDEEKKDNKDNKNDKNKKTDEEKKKIEDTFIEVYYPNEGYFTYYTKEDFSDELIDLAYSITIHKSQGQEYKSVIIPITFSHFNMLNAKLMYTAITRAKDRAILIGEDAAFSMACKKLEDIKRNTNLKFFIKECRTDIEWKEIERKIEYDEIDDDDIFILPF